MRVSSSIVNPYGAGGEASVGAGALAGPLAQPLIRITASSRRMEGQFIATGTVQLLRAGYWVNCDGGMLNVECSMVNANKHIFVLLVN